MLVVTSETIPGKNIQPLSLVQGNVVWSKHIGRDFMAGMKTIVGGEIRGYTEMLTEARNVALQRMTEEARRLNADAVVCMRYTSNSVMQGAAELLAFGTAVKFV